MIAKDLKVTVLKVLLKEGIGKTSNKPYRFYTASVLDEDGNVFGFNLSDAIVKEALDEDVDLGTLRNEDRSIDVEFKPKGFDTSGTIVHWE